MEEGGLVYEGKWENGMKHGQACGWALKTYYSSSLGF
jgi:hypothetical protein